MQALRRPQPAALWRRSARFARELRARRFDLVVDFHSILRSALLGRLSGAPRRVGYARPFGRELSPLFATDRARLPRARISRFERNQALVRFLGIEAPPARRPLRLAAGAKTRAEAALAAYPVPVAMHPGSSRGTPHKRWAPEGYGLLARRLARDVGATSLVTWGPEPGEREGAEAVVAASRGAARLAPETPGVDDLAALLAACRLYVGGDTGPLHVASLVGTPVVQLLGPTDPVENLPWPGTPSRTLHWSSVEAAGPALAREADAAFAASAALLEQAGGPRRGARSARTQVRDAASGAPA
jgi:ADP-heptose:LPS heptosyltransferase